MKPREAIHARLTATWPQRKQALRDLVRIDSTTGEEERIQAELGRRMRARGIEVDVLPIDEAAARSIAPAGMERPAVGGPNVLGTLRGTGGGRSLLLLAHCDTVPAGPAEQWSVPPLGGVVRDGAMWGRGTCDTKAGLAAALCALSAVQDAGPPLAGDVALLSTIGEEAGMPGARSFAAARPAYDGAIVAEPTGLAVVPAHAGFAHARVHIRGRGAHGSVPHEGVSAIDMFADLLQALRDLESRRGADLLARGFIDETLHRDPAKAAPINVGAVHGGTSSATVAEQVTCLVRLGTLPGEDLAAAKREFEEHIARWASPDPWLAANPPRVEWTGAEVPGGRVPVDEPIARATAESVRAVSGRPAELRAMPFGAEMVHLVAAGVPTVMFGPGSAAHAHGIDERVSLREYDVATHVLAETIVRWCEDRS